MPAFRIQRLFLFGGFLCLLFFSLLSNLPACGVALECLENLDCPPSKPVCEKALCLCKRPPCLSPEPIPETPPDSLPSDLLPDTRPDLLSDALPEPSRESLLPEKILPDAPLKSFLCRSHTNCASTERCRFGICVPRTTPLCGSNAQCSPPASSRCTGGHCLPAFPSLDLPCLPASSPCPSPLTEPCVSTFAGGSSSFQDNPIKSALLFNPHSIAISSQGTLYLTDTGNHLVRKYAPSNNTTCVVAGTPGSSGFQDGPAASSLFSSPTGLAIGFSGELFVADQDNHRIRKIAGGQVTTLAGSAQGKRDGSLVEALFSKPQSLLFDRQKNLYIGDSENFLLRKITPAGEVSTYLGTGVMGITGGEPTVATLCCPGGFLSIGDRFLFSDPTHHILRITDINRNVGLFAGQPKVAGLSNTSAATFRSPQGMTFSPQAEIVIADTGNHVIRGIGDAFGENNVKTIAGNGTAGFRDSSAGLTAALFQSPRDVAADPSGNLWVVDQGNHRIRRIDAARRTVVSILGNGAPTFYREGASLEARFQNPRALALDTDGSLYIADFGNHRLRKRLSTGVIATVAGTGEAGLVDGPALQAKLNAPMGLALDAAGNLYFSEMGNHTIRRLDKTGNVTRVAGNGALGFRDGAALQAQFSEPRSLLFDPDGNLLIADSRNNRIRKLDAQGNVTTIIGTGEAGFLDGDPLQAKLHSPTDLRFGKDGLLLLADTGNHRIRRLSSDGTLRTLAGTGEEGSVDGPDVTARFSSPHGLALDTAGNLYVAELGSHRLRKIDTLGNVTTIAGAGSEGFQDGKASQALFFQPAHLLFLSDQSLLISDTGNHRIRRLDIPPKP